MPTNLHALIRYRAIDESLTQRTKIWTWEMLSDVCAERIYEYEGIDAMPSRRTIMYDLQYMRSGKLGYVAPIVYDRSTQGYRYDDPDFSIQKFPLSRDDLFELQYALSILKNFKGFQNTSGIESIITKLEHTVTLQEPSKKEIIYFDHSLNEPGQRWLNELYEFIQQENVIEITYQPFYLDEPYKRTVSPYLIKEYDNRWFLVCWDHIRNDLRNFALDRLQKIEKVPIRFHLLEGFDPQHYFDNIIGITMPKGEQICEVTFRVRGDDAKYLITKPIHPSQEIIQKKDEAVDFSIKVVPNFELESVLLSFGERLEVLQPVNLKTNIGQRARALVELYPEV